MYAGNIESETISNIQYRKVISTDKHMQLVLMSLNPGEDIPEEIHKGSQFIRVEAGKGFAIIGGKKKLLKDGVAVKIPAGTKHYIKNTSRDARLKLYTLYSPPEHAPGEVDRRQPY